MLMKDIKRQRVWIWFLVIPFVSNISLAYSIPFNNRNNFLDAFIMPPFNAPASAYSPKVRSGSHGHPNADDLAGIAEQHRQKGHLSTALQLSLRVQTYAPDNVQAIQTEVSSLSNMGAAYLAYQLANSMPHYLPALSLIDFVRIRPLIISEMLWLKENDWMNDFVTLSVIYPCSMCYLSLMPIWLHLKRIKMRMCGLKGIACIYYVNLDL